MQGSWDMLKSKHWQKLNECWICGEMGIFKTPEFCMLSLSIQLGPMKWFWPFSVLSLIEHLNDGQWPQVPVNAFSCYVQMINCAYVTVECTCNDLMPLSAIKTQKGFFMFLRPKSGVVQCQIDSDSIQILCFLINLTSLPNYACISFLPKLAPKHVPWTMHVIIFVCAISLCCQQEFFYQG